MEPNVGQFLDNYVRRTLIIRTNAKQGLESA